ncbi:kinase-like protein [Hymenopellis radicata]|nr:kinase-like protein [Hymenopellis radicata]
MDWSKLVSSENNNEHLASQCRMVLMSLPAPWTTLVSHVDRQLSQAVMDVLQTEMDSDDVSRNDTSGYRMKCLRCLRVLGEHYDVVPSSFFCQSAEIFGNHALCGGGFSDIWKGSMKQITVSFKVLRVFAGSPNASELFKHCRREALLWRQLRHPSILPFYGVSDELFAPRLCLISPWMENGTLVEFLKSNPQHDRMKAANILVKNDLSCCLADFGLALIAESHLPGSSAMTLRGSLRWLPPEMMDFSLFQNKYFTALDIYSFGCTIIEIYTGEPPFSHVTREAALINEVLGKKRKPPRPSTELFSSDELWSLVMSCLAFTAKKRPTTHTVISSLKDLAELHRTWLKELPWYNEGHGQPEGQAVLEDVLECTRPSDDIPPGDEYRVSDAVQCLYCFALFHGECANNGGSCPFCDDRHWNGQFLSSTAEPVNQHPDLIHQVRHYMRKLYKIQFAVSPNPDVSFGLDLAQLHRILASRLPQNQKRPKFQFVQDLDIDWSDGTRCICRGRSWTLDILNYAGTVECEGCAKLYHAGCVFFPQVQNSTTRKKFTCPLCCLRKGTKYAYTEVRVLDMSTNAPVALAEVYVNTEAMLKQCSQLILYMNLPPIRKATVFVELVRVVFGPTYLPTVLKPAVQLCSKKVSGYRKSGPASRAVRSEVLKIF